MILTTLFVAPALACGGFFGPLGRVVSSDAQQAFFRIGEDSVSVEYRVRYTGTAEDFAWVLPVPGSVESVEEGDDQTFELAESYSAPRVIDARESHSKGGCLCVENSLSKGASDMSDTAGVTITGEGFAGDYAYVTLRATDGDSLQQWLADNEFDVQSAGAVIDAYVADPRGFEFVAVKAHQDYASPDAPTRFTPLRITYGRGADSELHVDFPATMGSTGTNASNHLEIYVLGTGVAEVGGGWTSTMLGDGGLVDVEDDEDWNAYYELLLEDLGGDERRLAQVWSDQFEEIDGEIGYLTRFDTIVAPSTQTSDIRFTDTGTMRGSSTTLQLVDRDGDDDADGDERTRTASFLVGIGALGAAIRRRIG